MTEFGALKVLAYSGGEWVIYLLLACSILTIAVIIERALVLRRERRQLCGLEKELATLLEKGNLESAASVSAGAQGAAARLLSSGLGHLKAGPAAVEEYIASAKITEKQAMERRLLILGSLGNNAPFIGLFGTVLGVIKAFHDLAETAGAGPEVVMQGLSEALIATAVGLLVAIPAVMAYNYFQKRVNDFFADIESLSRLLLARLRDESPSTKSSGR
ncbi:MAG TPA: MotA/TolQ/ExbB proton channel family protein [Elusimicrobiota bacterium]|nr:MotA/TolQ/ExbB proton channel family protein [Elusimicrobiota bacterium]